MARKVLLLALVLGALTGCASTAPPPPPAGSPAQIPAGDLQWWRVRIRIAPETDSAVAWHLDALLADQVLAPVLERYRGALPLWRVHRRAGNDATGHQLSFLFRADGAVAARVATSVAASRVLFDLKAAGLVREVMLPGPEDAMGAGLEATSDAGWPMVIQRTWPHFIMGVSEHWMALIAEIRAGRALPPARPISALVDAYRQINDEVNALWRIEAQHAYLHHLNALFGYQPLVLQERRLVRF